MGSAGDIITPGRDVPDWQNARLLLAADADGNYRLVGVDDQGRVLISAEIEVGDIQIGAVEMKDADTDVRVNVTADGAQNASFVQSNSLASQATLATRASEATLATRASEATLATRASQVTAAAIQTLLDIIDDAVGDEDDVHDGTVMKIGLRAEAGTRNPVGDGEIIAPDSDNYGRQRIAGFNPAQGALDITDVAPAQMQVLIETGWAALSADGDETPARDVRDYENHTIAYDITIGSLTSMDLIIWGSIDGTLWFPMEAFNVLASDPLEDAITFNGVQVTYIKCELEAENGNTDGSVVFQLTSGN